MDVRLSNAFSIWRMRASGGGVLDPTWILFGPCVFHEAPDFWVVVDAHYGDPCGSRQYQRVEPQAEDQFHPSEDPQYLLG